MESKTFSFKLLRNDEETLNFTSKKGDTLSIEKNKVKIRLADNNLKELENARFDTIVIKTGKKEETFKAKSYRKLPDNGATNLYFAIVNEQ